MKGFQAQEPSTSPLVPALRWRGKVTCAWQGALLTLAAPRFAHAAAATYLFGDPLGQRQGAGVGPQPPVTESLLQGDGFVRCNTYQAGDWLAGQGQAHKRGAEGSDQPCPGLDLKFGDSENAKKNVTRKK